jgi:hypothetical protein
MKSIQLIGAICLITIFSIFSGAFAQNPSNNIVPPAVSIAFKTKYPQAQIKSCKRNKSGYEVKFDLDKTKYSALYDQQGNWIKTIANVSWQWHLPKAVKTGLKKSSHGTWHPYDINLVETSGGQYYSVLVNNTNHPIDFAHQLVLTEDWEIDVTPSGKVINEKQVN